MENSFIPYENPNQSKLEAWRSEIQQMRSVSWPYQKIGQWLREEKDCSVHKDTIRKFCLVRDITKGSAAPKIPQQQPSEPKPSTPPEKKLFSYGEDESVRPIEIKRR